MSYFEEYYPHLRYPIGSETLEGLRRAQRGGIHGIGLHFTLYTEPALIVMPTGSGKTAVLNIAPFQQQAQRVLVLTPSRLVRGQIAEELAQLTTLKRIGVLEPHVPRPRVHEVRNHITSEAEWEALRAFDMVIAIPTTISPALANVPAPPEDLFDLVLVEDHEGCEGFIRERAAGGSPHEQALRGRVD